jgi:hypothetical protein
MTIIWGAFMAATVIYVFLAWIMFGQAEPTIADAEASLPAPVAPILGVLAFLVILASIFVERWWFSGARILAQLARPAAFDRLASARGSAAGAATGPDRAAFERLGEGERKLACLVPYYQTGMIVLWAMREAVAVFGLVAAIVTGEFAVVVPFALGALAFLAVKMPRPTAFLAQVKRLPGAVA